MIRKQGQLRRPYTGELAEPIALPGLAARTLLAISDEAARGGAAITMIEKKLPALLAHYGIDPSDKDAYQLLALRLACDWVPGFQVVPSGGRKRGAPRKTNPLHEAALLARVEARMKSSTGSGSLRRAVQYLRRKGAFGTLTEDAAMRRIERARSDRLTLLLMKTAVDGVGAEKAAEYLERVASKGRT